MASDAEIVIGIRGEVGGAKVIKRSLDDVANSGDKATREAARLERQMGSLNRAANLLKTAFVGLIGAMGIRELVRFSDGLTTMETRLRNVTRGTADYTQKFNALFKIAQETGDAFGGLVSNYVRLNSSLPEAIAKTTDLTKVTEILSRGFAASGTSAQAAGAVMIQLTQGLAGNFANAAQEINSLIEGAPLLAKTIAVELGGKAATDLKRMAEAGDLTTQSMLRAILGIEGAIKSFALPDTIERAWQRLGNAISRAGSESDILDKVSGALARALNTLAENADNLIGGITVLVGTSLPALIGLIGTALPAAFVALQRVMMANPIFALASLLSGAVTALYVFREEIAETLDKISVFGKSGGDIFRSVVEAGKAAFVGLGSIITGIFGGIVNTIEGALNNVEVMFFKLTDRLSQTWVGQKAGIKSYDLGSDFLSKIERAENSNAENFKDGFKDSAEEYAKWYESLDSSKIEEQNKALQEQFKLQREIEKAANDKAVAEEKSEEAIKAAQKAQDQLNSLIKETATEQERYNMRVAELEKLRGYADTEEEIRAINRAIKEAGEELEEFRLQAELDSPLAKTFANIATEIGDGFKDAFKDAFTATEGGWKKLVEGFKNTFKNLLAELAYQALARPIVLSVVAGGGMAAGLSSSAVAQTLGIPDMGGGSGMGGMGSLISNGFSALKGGLNAPIFGAGSMVGGAIDKIGGAFGFSNGAVYGPSGLSSAFTPMAGIAGFGGNMLGNLLFGGDRGIGASIGGGIGGAVGTAAGAHFLGTALGSFAGPVGALGGALLGNALGGLFGGSKPSDKAQMGSLNLATGEIYDIDGMTGKKFSQENADFRDAVLEEAQNLANLLRSFGAELEGSLRVHIGSRDGLRIGGANGKNYGNDADRFIEAVMAKVAGSATGLNATSQTILDNVGFKDTQKLAAALQFGKEYDAFIAPQSDKSQLEQALANLDAQFKAMSGTASELGLNVGKLTDVYNKQKQALRDDFIANIENAILAIKDPALLAANQLEEQFDAMRSDADALGVDKTKLEELYDLRQKILKAEEAGFSNLKDLADNLLDFLDQQKFSADSSLSPTEKLAAAQDKFGSVLSDAQGGDYAAIGQLTGAASTLLDTARDVYASSVSFAGIEQFVRSSLESIGKEMDLPGFASGTHSAPQGMAWVGERGPELVKFKGGEQVIDANQSSRMGSQTNALLSEIVEQNKELVRDNKLLRKQLERVSNKMAVRG